MTRNSSYLKILMITTFFFSLATGMIGLGLVFYLTRIFNADHSMIGFITLGQTLSYLLGIIGFSLSRNTHPRYFIGFSTTIMAASVATYLLFPVWGITLVFNCLYGFGTALFWPRISGWISWGLEGVSLSRTMSQYNFSWSSGGILAPAIGGALAEVHVALPLIMAVVIYTFISILLPVFSHLFPEMKKGHEEIKKARLLAEAQGENPSEIESGITEMTPLRYPAWFGVISSYIATGFIIYIFPAFMKETLGFREGLVGVILVFRQLFAAVGFSLWGRWKGWHFKGFLIPLNQFATLILLIFLTTAESPWQLIVILSLYGMNYSFTYILGQYYMTTGSTNRERSMAFHEAACNIGVILGVYSGGFLSDRYGTPYTFRIFCLACFLTTAVQLIMLAQQKKTSIRVSV